MPHLSQWLTGRLQKRFHGRRAELFRRYLRPSPRDRILDLGGGYGDYFATVVAFRRNVWIADIDERILRRARQHGFRTVLMATDGTVPFSDGYFDIVHCNSVIEHVVIAAHRRRLASEIRRVGRNWFIQTPNRDFFLEPHTFLPLAQFLPWSWLRLVMRCLGHAGDGSREWRLLDRRELLSLFPEGKLLRERFWGLTKSLIVVGGERVRDQAEAAPATPRAISCPPP
jgi:ubiquinone/menaquinone biosynthesis C-methylase UbiE